MTAPDSLAETSKKPLAERGPSIHDGKPPQTLAGFGITAFVARGAARFACPFDRLDTLAQRLHHGDLLTKRTSRDLAAPFRLPRKDIGDIWKRVFGIVGDGD
jgi:hypothetical protein